MREIKFRAWDGEKMVEVAELHLNTKELLVDDEEWLSMRYSPLMQFTGLKDKNGREIYEGDILDIGLRDQDGKPVVAPVSYEAYLAGYVLDNRGYGIWQRLGGDCEVVGNIFENPELLEAYK